MPAHQIAVPTLHLQRKTHSIALLFSGRWNGAVWSSAEAPARVADGLSKVPSALKGLSAVRANVLCGAELEF